MSSLWLHFPHLTPSFPPTLSALGLGGETPVSCHPRGSRATGGPHPCEDPRDRLWPLEKLHGFTVGQVLEAFRDVHACRSAAQALGGRSRDAGRCLLGTAVRRLQTHPGAQLLQDKRDGGGMVSVPSAG